MKQLRNLIYISIFLLSCVQAIAQGDFAPYEKPEKLQKIINNDAANTNTSAEDATAGEQQKPVAPSKKKSKAKAKPKAIAKPKDPGQSGKVKIDGAAVYEVANFDSPVIEYMDQGKKIKISKKVYPGIGGLGSFYKVKLNKGVFGYIADTDVEAIRKRSGDDDSEESRPRESEGKIGDDGSVDPLQLQGDLEREDADPAIGGSLLLTRYVGFTYYNLNYSEVLRKVTETEPVSLVGAKISGPLGIMGGMPLDVNLILTTTAPKFYNEISSSTSGMMIIGDMLVMIPLYESKSVLVNYGFGLVGRYSKWSVKLKNSPTLPPLDSQEITMGVAANAGVGFKLGASLVLRADAKYYYEKEKYFGYGAAIQYKY
jgi:hypothetical protein